MTSAQRNLCAVTAFGVAPPARNRPAILERPTGGEAVPTSGAAAAAETVVFEVTGMGTALTIDLVPSGDERLLNVPLPWSTTVTITPDVAQLQVVVVGSGDAAPGCRITLNGEVVAEKPDGGDAHCVFDR